MPDGTPYNTRFGDRYHSEDGGLKQAKQVFLGGCGLPAAWANAPQWRILETGFGFGLNFLVTWAAWKADPQRARLLHFVSVEAFPVSREDLLRSLPADEELRSLGLQLADQWWGLLPGVHRLSFDNGQVLLTLYIGPAQIMLRKQQLTVDSVYLDGFSPQLNPELWDEDAMKNIARHCRRGTQLATWCVAGSVRQALKTQGFDVQKIAGTPPKRHNLQASYNPAWEPRQRVDGFAPPVQQPSHCLVLGAGLAGAAAAASLARRGWQVTVLDSAAQPAAGASGLPAGLFCPHVSPDDSVLSRLSRSGVRTTLQTLQQLSTAEQLLAGQDWAHSGVLEHDLNEPTHLPPQWLRADSAESGWGLQWSNPASSQHLAAAHLPNDSHALWHAQAGWVRPAQLVRALLQSPLIQWQGNAHAAKLLRDEASGQWQVLNPEGQTIAQAPMLVLALGPTSKSLLQASGMDAGLWELQAIRGQVSVADHTTQTQAAMPPFPVNGNGNLVPDFLSSNPDKPSSASANQWIMGSTFERDVTELPPSQADQLAAHAGNAEKLAALLPECSRALQTFFTAQQQPETLEQTWARVRCAAYDRLPLAGPIGKSANDQIGLWVLTGLGSRGLTLSMLCGELLAARLHGEPLPLDAKLAQSLGTQRLWSRVEQVTTKPTQAE
ncbi:FAD-dependent 5-carboxymethylaminomethyl-2-thiouridine(34) oxidoreductase MnmC [Comamonas sp. Y33R10-2]|uniref:FAD-dependent 5-carboxymethylaminomethyl-2-thiouridine(34) oxidoreductase MnmC n=1 Tax=Comamonas sp. Y33R10-2 TaxID=2853257 RepID=UPI001C5CBE57|nr:FAD-dependent 5-carboxymethylaminomethyl-2-thiouridine(34) oxidoreductase MnmC [Comamonas sp. Y33R10-2]QXZ11357.1 FAD-dependent 5-carboxymethylaminomethyl-2-thiouridine(34) oxidoreductase MnmC [Comamonas sp. Y33R10-2]